MIRDMENMVDITNWAGLLKQMLETFGFGYMWHQQNLLNKNDTAIISLFKQRLHDVYLQRINADIFNVISNRLYKHLNVSFVNNGYLNSTPGKYIRIAITKFRLGSHNLMIERGRWLKLELIDRECTSCGKLDDEFHVLTECRLYTTWRKKYLPNWLYNRPSMHKLVTFLDNVKGKQLINFGLYCHKVNDYINKNII